MAKRDLDYKSMEELIMNKWLDSDVFIRSKGFGKNVDMPYTITIPPPNITGVLHMGHALNDTIQDTCIRHARMLGKQTRWILGTDHAGIATQTKVDKKLQSEGISRMDIGREAFIKQCQKWRAEYGATIVEQIKSMGCSCDYNHEHFTIDEDYAYAVKKVFCDWYKHGLIYKGKRIVNWCPSCTTAIADDEAEYIEETGKLWYIKYLLSNPADDMEYLVVATTRPETMLGDSGIVVNPKDARFSKLVGKTAVLPLLNREIPIIADYHVDTEFGTGCVKVTPAHDPNDWTIGKTHDLEFINVFDEHANVLEGYGRYSGMNRDECRDAVCEDLEAQGLMFKIEDIEHSVITCYRCHTKLEPWESEQWFVAVDKLKEEAKNVVKDEMIKFYPARWKQVYLNWLDNLKDWCISRQLWWGHRIPIYYCPGCGWEDACMETPDDCPKCGEHVEQDPDVLDTWFSSQLWPFATMDFFKVGMESPEMKFYPTDVLSTARDIMGLWVARMVMSSMYFTKEIPFKNVVIHPTVMGYDGKPMSKSAGNGVDPLELMQSYGADGMRFGLLMQVTGSQDFKFNEAKLVSSRNFASKIKNAARFVEINLEGFKPAAPQAATDVDKWIFTRLAEVLKAVDKAYANFEFGEITRLLYSFVWNEFCDWYIEFSKVRTNIREDASTEQKNDRAICQNNLLFVLEKILKILQPIMPFVTEDIFSRMFAKNHEFLMSQAWPQPSDFDGLCDKTAKHSVDMMVSTISAARCSRARYSISPRQALPLFIKAEEADLALLKTQEFLIKSMANISEFKIGSKISKPAESVVSIDNGLEIYVVLAGFVDFKLEKSKLSKKLADVEKDKVRLEKKLNNTVFLAKAKPEIIEKDRAKLKELSVSYKSISEQIQDIS
ncbi:MAG: valine--tRNA ligase [Eggerthellaceae bacterium]|nr:valine--tRNA ligase [Eggerthellaceae bacterium]